MSGGITVKEFKHIPGVNDAEYIKILEELNEINQRIINKAVAKIKMLSAQPERKTGRWIESNPRDSKVCRLMTCSECGKAYIVNINVPYEDWTEAHKFCVECGAKMEGGDE